MAGISKYVEALRVNVDDFECAGGDTCTQKGIIHYDLVVDELLRSDNLC